MTLKMRLFLLALAACYISAVYAAGLPFSNDPKCKCITQTSAKINPKTFHHIEMIPRGAHCSKVEIIVTLKNKHVVCVNPEATWIQHVITVILQRRNTTAVVDENPK
ncbi:growth-regulated alpha protein [Polyodon spathula]|uniref:growth-regulated alpha protein n=1 Tax=Polyodon spathula TaxID=7913 RepID=UPI001B7ED6F4|nr:growth-regulated alpha protein [Polyodon spathula]